MADVFELFRLTLLQRQQIDLVNAVQWNMSREEWLRMVFSEKIEFTSHNSEYCYLPFKEQAEASEIIGRVGRHITRDENRPPEEGLEEYEREAWVASVIVIDPTHHQDGQKAAIQSISVVGRARSLIRKLVAAINDIHQHGPYALEVNEIVDTQEFWDYVKENRGNLTSVTFVLNAPNMFGGTDDWDEDIRALRDQENIQKMSLTLKSDDGLVLETERIRQAANYAEKTSGKITARANGKPSYVSTNSAKRSRLGDIKEAGSELVKVAAKYAARILGREQDDS